MKTSTQILVFLFSLWLTRTTTAGTVVKLQGSRTIIEFEEDEPIRLHQKYVVLHPDNEGRTGIIEIIKKRKQRALCKILKGSVQIGGRTQPLRTEDGQTIKSFDALAEVTEASNEIDPDILAALDQTPTPTKKKRSLASDTDINDNDNSKSTAELKSNEPRTTKTPSEFLSQDENTASKSNEITEATESWKEEPGEIGYEAGDNPFEPVNSVSDSSTAKNKSLGSWGFGMGVSPTEIKVGDDLGTNTLKGNSFVLRAAYDRSIQFPFSLMAGLSLLPLNANQVDPTLGLAMVDASYLAFDINGRIHFMGSRKEGPWVGAGVGYLSVKSRTSNVINPDSIGSQTLFQLNAGFNARMDSEYLMFRGDWLFHTPSSVGTRYVKITQYIISAIYFF